ncbi:MAG: hypothetical protein H0V38_05735, partial [Sporichthyaceae bacterium]|nr:hypothetical protein [Sporichthyaceae bacterium]
VTGECAQRRTFLAEPDQVTFVDLGLGAHDESIELGGERPAGRAQPRSERCVGCA